LAQDTPRRMPRAASARPSPRRELSAPSRSRSNEPDENRLGARQRRASNENRVFDASRVKALDREALQQIVAQLKVQVSELKADHTELKTSVRSKEKDSFRKDRLLQELLATALPAPLAQQDMDRAQEELQLLLQHKKRAFELRAQVEDREQTVQGIEQELRSNRTVQLQLDIDSLRATCHRLRDQLRGKDVKWTAEMAQMRAEADRVQEQLSGVEAEGAERSAGIARLREQTRGFRDQVARQQQQVEELKGLQAALAQHEVQRGANGGPAAELASLRATEQQHFEEVARLREEVLHFKQLQDAYSAGKRGRARPPELGWLVKDPFAELREPKLREPFARARRALDSDGRPLLAQWLRRADRDHDLLVTGDELVAAVRPLGVPVGSADVEPLLEDGVVGWPDLLLQADRAADGAEGTQADADVLERVREHCVANGVERGAFLAQMRSRHDRALYCEQDLGMSSLLAGRASRIFEQLSFAWPLPAWTVLAEEDRPTAWRRFFTALQADTFRVALEADDVAGGRPQSLLIQDFNAMAMKAGGGPNAAALFLEGGRVNGEHVHQLKVSGSWEMRYAHPSTNPDPTSDPEFEDDFEDDFEGEESRDSPTR